MPESREIALEKKYNSYYKEALKEHQTGNLKEARHLYFQSAQTLNELCKISFGDLKVKRQEEIVRLAKLIRKLDSLILDQNLTSKKKNNHLNKNKEETETRWEAVENLDITFEDIAGLEEVKNALRKKVLYPRTFPEYYKKFNIQLSGGILMYGLPGTGKTMMAKAIASEITGCKFYSVNCSDIVSKWVGESERNIKNLFETARNDKFAVIFFDEFEAIGSKRTEDDSNKVNRVVTELLTQMQGFNGNDDNILVIAATNRPWQIDSALMRPGRFSDRIYIPLPDKEAREFLIKKSWKNVPLASDININQLVEDTEGFNSADVIYLCEICKVYPVERAIDNGDIENERIMGKDVENAKQIVHSSVQLEDIKHLNEFQNHH